MTRHPWLLLCTLLVGMSTSSRAATLAFDDLTRGQQVGNSYAINGVVFSLTDAGVQEGLANGDSGAWGVNGTAGPAFLGFNGLPPSTYTMVLIFNVPVMDFAMDAVRSIGSSPGNTITVSGFLGNSLLASQTAVFGDVNQWTRITLAGVHDRIEWVGNGSGFHPFGVDNLTFTAVPEPSLTLMLLTVGAVLGARRVSPRSRTSDSVVSPPLST